jgi:hypothetical protein
MYGQKAIFVAKVRKKIQLFSHLEENLLERTHFENQESCPLMDAALFVFNV